MPPHVFQCRYSLHVDVFLAARRHGWPSLRGRRETSPASGQSAHPPCPQSRLSTSASTGGWGWLSRRGKCGSSRRSSAAGHIMAGCCVGRHLEALGACPANLACSTTYASAATLLPRSEPLFCFETAIKLLYWSFLVRPSDFARGICCLPTAPRPACACTRTPRLVTQLDVA